MNPAFDAIVIGGGAAGCYAALTAARRGRSVAVLERGKHCCQKLRITGKGRCNLTNNCTLDTLLGHIPRGGRFFYSAFSACMPQDVMEEFTSLGVPLKTERGNRVFPVSDRSEDIVSALLGACRSAGVSFFTDCRVQSLLLQDGTCIGVKTETSAFQADSVLIACGGASYPKTGSSGDGYRLAEQAGHTVIPPRPSLIPIVTEEDWCKDAMGLSLRNVRLTLTDRETGRSCYEEQGEMLFTHFGVSGPLVLSASAYLEHLTPGRYCLSIDLKPALHPEQLDARIQRDFAKQQNRQLCNALGQLLPAKLIPIIIRLSGIAPETKVHQITREQRLQLGQLLKALPLTVRDVRPMAEAIITRGGVALKELSPKTMESKLVSGLYFAGEVLDADALTGGFNLQIAFSSGFAAGLQL